MNYLIVTIDRDTGAREDFNLFYVDQYIVKTAKQIPDPEETRKAGKIWDDEIKSLIPDEINAIKHAKAMECLEEDFDIIDKTDMKELDELSKEQGSDTFHKFVDTWKAHICLPAEVITA